MTEKNLKGLFGGGEADDAPSAQSAPRPERGERRGGRGGGRGGRRRRRNPEEVAQAEDFINRYTTGNPSEGFSSEEAVGYLKQLRGEAPPEVLQRAAVESVRNLPEDQRKAFAEMLQRRQAGSGMVTIERTGETRATEGRGGAPGGSGDDMLGGLFGSLFGGGMAQTQPRGQTVPANDNNPFGDLFGGLFGGGDDEATPPQQRQQPQEQRGGVDEILSSTLGKAVLGGIAAFALKEMMDKDR